ncbi:MAG TPA: hypothetical protein VNE63_01440 [Candidatus Acidoferrales bacterium]|nr:hypothetical protein [Candidatus Acidoferrales bacterium]
MPKRGPQIRDPKRVVYLWGAGATQAEASYLGALRINLLMLDNEELGEGVATRILTRLPAWRNAFGADRGTDIEKLVSLLAASNVDRYHKLAEKIRKLYFEDICKSLAAAGVLMNPELAIGLLTMHGDSQFKKQETLTGIITTNHDGLLQLAAQRVNAEVNIGIPFRSNDITQAETRSTPPLLHLHGSFTWTFGLPIEVSLLDKTSAYSPKTVWIPPTILKEAKDYPFNKLAGLAYELLSRNCDVLRVVGSALTQNDWNILSLIFNAQRHAELTKGAPFRVELIMPHGAGIRIKDDCSYLKNLTPIGFLSDGDFTAYKERGEGQAPTSEMKNPLFYWMKQKIMFHRNRGEFVRPLALAIAKIAGDPGGGP